MGCLSFTHLIPIIWPLAAEMHLPLVHRYTFKNNVWVFIVTDRHILRPVGLADVLLPGKIVL